MTWQRQLARSKPYQEEIDALQGVTGFLIRSQEEEKERLRTTIDRLLKGSKIVPLDSEILVSARKYQLDHDLSPHSIIYASVLKHFSTSSSEANCFLNRNSKDFDDPDIVDVLNGYGCKMLFSFDDGYSYIFSQIRS